MTRAFWVADTFRLAIGRISDHWWKAWAWGLFSNSFAFSVWTTRRRLARISWRRLLDNLELTSYERISCISLWACTNGIVISNLTICIDSTCAWARVNTFLVVASFILRTFCTRHTFRSTSGRCSNVSRNTWTNCLTIDLTTLRVGATRWRLARICFDRSWTTETQ